MLFTFAEEYCISGLIPLAQEASKKRLIHCWQSPKVIEVIKAAYATPPGTGKAFRAPLV